MPAQVYAPFASVVVLQTAFPLESKMVTAAFVMGAPVAAVPDIVLIVGAVVDDVELDPPPPQEINPMLTHARSANLN